MALFRCARCKHVFPCKSSHYCLDMEFIYVPKGVWDSWTWTELIDWQMELITNNENLKLK